MSDASVAEALRSEVHRVVVEAPAGTGKTHQAASYARDATTTLGKGQRVLILAHTHSACDVFSSRTTDLAGRLRIGTIDSLVATIAQIYHRPLTYRLIFTRGQLIVGRNVTPTWPTEYGA